MWRWASWRTGAWRAFDRDAWFETGDIGRLEDGLLWFEGRADDVINCGGIKIAPDLLEAAVRGAVPGAGDFGLLRRPDPLRGDGIGLVLGPDARGNRDRLRAAVIAEAAAHGVRAQGAVSILEADNLPRTATGKLRRAELARTLDAEGAAGQGRGPSGGQEPPESFAALLTRLLGTVPPERCFADLEADSLAHMQVNMVLERALGTAAPGWEWRPLGELMAEVEAAGDFQALMERASGAPPLPDGSRNMNPDMAFWSLVAEDYRTNDASVFHQGFLMLFVHRFGNVRMAVRPKLLRAPLTVLYRFLNKLTQLFFGMKLDYTVKVGRRVKLEHFGGMILGAREIGNDVIIRQNTTFGIRSTADLRAKPVIGDFVDIGAGAVIVGNVTVGANSIIGANSVVFTNVPPNAVVMGVPGPGHRDQSAPEPLAAGGAGGGPGKGPGRGRLMSRGLATRIAGRINRRARRAWLERLPLSAVARRLSARRGVAGLCYHSLSPELDDYRWRTRAEAFDGHLAFLKDIFEIVTAAEAVAALGAGDLAGRERPLAVICFDDGYRDNWTVATAILERHGVPATLFAARDLIVRPNATYMDPADLAELARHPLWQVDAHGVTHNVLPGFLPGDQLAEMRDCADWLAELTGSAPRGFAYPQGQLGPGAVAHARSLFDYAFATDVRTGPGFDPFQIRRYCPVQADDRVEVLARSLLEVPFEDGHA